MIPTFCQEGASKATLADRLKQLRIASAAILAGSGTGERSAAVSPDQRLERGKVHEWIGVEAARGTEAADGNAKRGDWSPPLSLLIEMTRRELAGVQDGQDRVLWIGERVWPYPAALVAAGIGLERSLFVRARRAPERLWAIDLALRSRVGMVIADGSRLDLSATRRLQLASEAGKGLCLLARPAWERSELSAAATRWLVRGAASSSMNRRWTVELLRCKGLQPVPGAGDSRAWVVERDRATRSVRVVADVLDRPGEEAAGEAVEIRRTG